MNFQEIICGGLNETFGSTVADQPQIKKYNERMKMIRQIMEGRQGVGMPESVALLDRLADLSYYGIKAVYDDYMSQFKSFYEAQEHGYKYEVKDIEI